MAPAGGNAPADEGPDLSKLALERWGVDRTPTHPATDLVEVHLISWLETGDPEILEQVLGLEGQLARQDASLPYGRFLRAYTRRILQDAEGEAAALAGLPPEYPSIYRYFFGRPKDAVLTYLKCNQVNSCLTKAGRRGESPPGIDTFEHVGWDDQYDPAPVRCEEVTVDPRSCATDWRAFERFSLVNHGLDRLVQWRSDASASPEDFARMIGIAPGMTVADVGSELGFFTYPFSRTVGPDGWVYAVEIDDRFLAIMDGVIQEGGFPNITTVFSRPEDLSLTDRSVDVVFMCNVIKDIFLQGTARVGRQPAHEVFWASVRRALRPGGRLIVVDDAEALGVPEAFPSALPNVTRVLADHGFTHVRSIKDYQPREAIEIYAMAE